MESQGRLQMGLVSALQDLGDRATTQGGKDLIALLIDVYRAGTQGKRPTTAAFPGGVVDIGFAAKRRPRLRVQ
jgi:hypothetical protein